MMDLWDRVGPIFTAVDGAHPEINVENVSEDIMRFVLNYMLYNSKSVESGFRSITPPHPQVVVNFPSAVPEVVLAELIVGPLVAEMRWDGCTLPPIAAFILDKDAFFISYEMGAHWNPVNVTALFEFFRLLKSLDKYVQIRLSREHFGASWRVQWDMTLKEYIEEHAP